MHTPPIAEITGQLDTTAQEITDTIAQLIKKLEPVLNPNEKSCTAPETEKKAAPSSPLATHLNQINFTNKRSKIALLDLLNNLEV